MDYVTSVELFIDLKPRICEVCGSVSLFSFDPYLVISDEMKKVMEN